MQPTRLKVLKAIQKLSLIGWPPTRREIGREIGIPSTGNINHHIDRLEQCGYVERRPGRVGVLATDEGRKAIALSLLPLVQRTAVIKGKHEWSPTVNEVWQSALDKARHGLFDIVKED